MKEELKYLDCKCLRCNHLWRSRVNHRPNQCPQCGSRIWDRAKNNFEKKEIENIINPNVPINEVEDKSKSISVKRIDF